MLPLTVGKKRVRLIFFDYLFEHGYQMLNGIFLRVFEIERVIPLINRMINAELNVRLAQSVFELAAKIPVRTYVNAVPAWCIIAFIHTKSVMVF